ncbi:MAG: imidazole glycerol phosphate synthase subunit HisH [Cyanobacteriota bacterium]|nr:imidazole glycerol phosphate synthase subunit HisH [Cyanobacteriota bacterium]
MVRIALIDYDTGNLHSACRGLEFAGAIVDIVTQPDHLDGYDGLVLPGDGAFDPAIQHLRSQGFEQPLKTAIAQGIPFLGICIGLQLLMEWSEEGEEPGLGLVAGGVKRLQPEAGVRIPHMGWNHLHLTQPDTPLWQGIPEDPWVYFVHSYYVQPEDPSWIAATVTHGSQTMTAAIGRGCLMATQFHPEKSGTWGLQMVKNFVQMAAEKNKLCST